MSSETSAAAAQPEKQPEVPAMEAIDEDDEFEEFKIESWNDKDKLNPADDAWADDWDDEDADTDFDKVLKAELEKAQAAAK